MLARATPLHGLTMRMFGVPESEIAKSLREIEDDDGVDVEAVEVTTCLRRGEIEIDVRWREETEAVAMAVRDGLQRRHPRETFSLDGADDRRAGGEAAGRGTELGLAESCSGGLLAARITNVPGASDYFDGQRRRLLLRGQRRAARGAEGADRGVRRGVAGGRRGDGEGGAGALRRRRRGLDHRDRRAGRGDRGEAGRLRLLQRPARRRHRRSPAIRSSPAAATTSANARGWSGCTCCASSSAATTPILRPKYSREFAKRC